MIITRCNVNPAVACKMHIRSHTIHPTIDEKNDNKNWRRKEKKKTVHVSSRHTNKHKQAQQDISYVLCIWLCEIDEKWKE